MRAIERGDCPRIKQNEEEATYYPLLKKETGIMDLGQTAVHLANQVRGLSPRPGAYIGEYKILWAEPEEWEGTEIAGTILKADPKQGLLVRAGEGALRIVRLQAPGGKVMDARDYLRGHRMEAGTLIVCSLAPERVKNVIAPLEDYPALLPSLVELAKEIAGSTHCPLAEALRLMLPAEMRGARVRVKTETVATLTVSGVELESAIASCGRAHKRRLLLQLLSDGQTYPVSGLSELVSDARTGQ